ncbi:N,N-dimethylformamidase beta subunit family domain-containing protein [Streptomyces pseudogriseolus]|uniref:N,N-dimethylformamidase beta subunit family domain-containing protein n=1 Tax=Streptomyces pseudogriseolus TaxID=36817 RepID=UPI003FA20AD8
MGPFRLREGGTVMRPERVSDEATGSPAPDDTDPVNPFDPLDPFAPVTLPWTTPSPPAVPTAPAASDDGRGRIEGFASASAVAAGDSIGFHVTVDPPRPFRVTVHRIGHYDGRGAAEIVTSPRLDGTAQLPPLTAGRTVSCHHWWLSWRLPVPSYWSAGAYVAVLATEDGRHQAHVPFTVRDDRASDLLLVLPDLTWQAYNPYPAADGRAGASLAPADDEHEAADPVTTVTFDRPYAGDGLPPQAGHAYDVIRWAERHGYDLGYATAGDLHAGRVAPARHRGLVFPGRDEYWTDEMRTAVEDARERGTSLVFLAARTLYRRIEPAPAPSGSDRLLTCGRRRGRPGPALWRENDRAEQQLLGIQYAGPVPRPRPLIVRNAGHWLWEATGAHEGDALDGLVAGGADRYYPRTPLPAHDERILLAHSPYGDRQGARRHQETSLYRAPSGAWVFASGTLAWSPALDRPGHADPRIQRATANLFDRICKRD